MKQIVEEVARENILFNHRTVDRTLYGKDLARFGEINFVQGAEWRINSVWHDWKDEQPECGKHAVTDEWIDFIAKDEKDLKRIVKSYGNGKWAYVDDLLPDTFDEILEANRDVLERIKEK